ncbi:MAG: adenosylcobinamide-phosphate synthase CbiB [Pseudomonadota bacterium]
MLIGLCLDLFVGWPDWLYRRIGHPVSWIGQLIDLFDRRWNRGPRRNRIAMGAAVTAIVSLAAALPALALELALPSSPWGMVLAGIVAWPWLAARSLHDHVTAVALPLSDGQLNRARVAVAHIVGRDPTALDGPAIARAAAESLAENTSDGVIAPLFWGAVAGLPGLVAYKAINTLDSMIGHRSEAYEAFGKAAARLDDLVNWLPARLTALLIALASGPKAGAALKTMGADARHHRSPNAGWPEAAMAGALGIRLSGPRVYGDMISQEPWINGASPDPGPLTLADCLALYRRTVGLTALALFALAFL